MAKTLKTPGTPLTAVFRAIVQQVKTYPQLKAVLGDRLRSWEGVPADKSPMQPSNGQPVMRLTPTFDPEAWYSPDSQYGPLVVAVELAIASLCIDDVTDLWGLLCSSLHPDKPGPLINGQPATLAQNLVAAGAETGEIKFTKPASDPRPDAPPEGEFHALGFFELSVITPVNT